MLLLILVLVWLEFNIYYIFKVYIVVLINKRQTMDEFSH